MCTCNQCFEQNKKKPFLFFQLKSLIFTAEEQYVQYIVWACFRMGMLFIDNCGTIILKKASYCPGILIVSQSNDRKI